MNVCAADAVIFIKGGSWSNVFEKTENYRFVQADETVLDLVLYIQPAR